MTVIHAYVGANFVSMRDLFFQEVVDTSSHVHMAYNGFLAQYASCRINYSSLRMSGSFFFGTYAFYDGCTSSLQSDKSFFVSYVSLIRTKKGREQRICAPFFFLDPTTSSSSMST